MNRLKQLLTDPSEADQRNIMCVLVGLALIKAGLTLLMEVQ